MRRFPLILGLIGGMVLGIGMVGLMASPSCSLADLYAQPGSFTIEDVPTAGGTTAPAALEPGGMAGQTPPAAAGMPPGLPGRVQDLPPGYQAIDWTADGRPIIGYTDEGQAIVFTPGVPPPGAVAATVDYAGRLILDLTPLPGPLKEPAKDAWSDLVLLGSMLLGGGVVENRRKWLAERMAASPPGKKLATDVDLARWRYQEAAREVKKGGTFLGAAPESSTAPAV